MNAMKALGAPLEAGCTRAVAETRKLDEINTVFADVLAGRVPARVVLEF
jgi:alcohol dehydrogenase, propanol-preferring